MAYRYYVCNTETGNVILEVYPTTAGTWMHRLNADGTPAYSHDFLLTANPGLKAPDGKYRTRSWHSTLVVEWAGQVLYAGVVQSREYDEDSNTLTIYHGDVRAVLGKRTTFRQDGYSGAADPLVFNNLTLASIATGLVKAGTTGAGGAADLPIVFGSSTNTGTHDRKYHDYDLMLVDDALTEVQNVIDGPDIDFDPSWDDDHNLQWTMRAGQLTAGVYEFNMTAPQRKLQAVKYRLDATKKANRVYAVGAGSEKKMLVATASDPTMTVPLLERVESYKQTKTMSRLQGHADADLATFNAPTRQHSASMQVADAGDLKLGATFRLYYSGNAWIPDGWLELRLIGYGPDGSDPTGATLQLIFQDTGNVDNET
jgi:hypothetical protein